MTKKRVLIVEDEVIVAMHLEATLDALGFEVAGAVAAAEDAIRKCEESRPDLILMDIVLQGGMDGIEASRIIKDRYDIPVVFITGNADMATVARARDTGPYGYVIKPVNNQDLFSTLDTALHRRGLEVKLRESEERYRRIAENMVDLISWVDRDDRFTYISPSHTKILGYELDEMYRMGIFETVHPDDREMVAAVYNKCKGRKPFIRGEFRCRHADGHYLWIECTTTYLFTADGRYDGAMFSSRDVTERNRAAEDLKRGEEKFRALFDQSSAGVFMYDRDLVVLDCNQQFADIINAPRERIIGLNLNILKERGIMSGIREALEGKPGFYEGPYVSTLTGSVPWISSTVSPLRGTGGEIVGGIGVVIDITSYKKTEEALKEQEESFRAIFEQSPVGIVLYSNDLKVTDCNKQFADMLESMRDRMVGFDIMKLRDQTIIPYLREALAGKTTYYEGPYQATTSDAVRWVSSSISPIRRIDGSVKGGLLVVVDLTRKHLGEKEQRERDEIFRAVFDQSPAGIVLFSRDLIVSNCNKRYAEIMHSTREKIIGFDIKNLKDKTVTPTITEALGGKTSYYEGPYMASTSDARLWVSFSASPIRDVNDEVMGAMVVVVDITERKKAEMALRESEERYRYLFDNANDFVFTLDLDGRYTSFNKKVMEKTGYSHEEGINMTISDIVTPEYRDLAWDMMKKKITDGDPTTYEVAIETKDGEQIPLEVSSQLIVKDGKPVGIQGIGRDITERKQMEEQIRKSLREKEALLKEIHHRVKNNFQVIMSLLNLQSSNIESWELQKYFEDAQSRIRSMALVHELLYQSEDISRLDLSMYIATIVNELYASHQHATQIREPRIEAKRIELTIDQAIPCGLIINELVTNALKYAFPPGWKGDPDIMVSVDEKDGVVELVVGDNGVGLPESVDFRSSRTLGLTLVPVLAKQLFGTVDLDRSRGARITVRFPMK